MANPNIVNVSDIRGKTFFNELTTSYATLLNNSAGSNSVYKINVISISNSTGAARTINIAVYRDPDGAGAVAARYYDIANNVSIPNNSTLVVTSKDTSFYLEEEDILVGSCNSAGCEVMVSYEIIS